ncbi:MAG: hypothetical protein ACI9QQ_000911 [Myxococcota bacterium]|jgi:hypothetical protein
MARGYKPEELAERAFYLSLAGIAVQVVVIVLLIF